MSEKENPTSPLSSLWNIFSVFGGVVGLASLADTLVQWKGFLLTIISAYQSIVHPFFRFLFSWLPFELPAWTIDYLTIGIVITISLHQAMSHYDDNIEPGWLMRVMAILIWAPIWPLMFLGYFFDFGGEQKKQTIYAWQWLGAIILAFILLLVINSLFI